MIVVKRVYDPPAQTDGFRVLVDRLWPRGLSRERARVDLWLKEVAPSEDLRRWFAHDPERWEEFRWRYQEELRGKGELLRRLKGLEAEHGVLTLLYAAKDKGRNNAVVLREVLAEGRWGL